MGARVLSATNPLTVKYWALPEKMVKKLSRRTANRIWYYKRTLERCFWLHNSVEILAKSDRITLLLFYARFVLVRDCCLNALRVKEEPGMAL